MLGYLIFIERRTIAPVKGENIRTNLTLIEVCKHVT